jgi:hypothetical protein
MDPFAWRGCGASPAVHSPCSRFSYSAGGFFMMLLVSGKLCQDVANNMLTIKRARALPRAGAQCCSACCCWSKIPEWFIAILCQCSQFFVFLAQGAAAPTRKPISRRCCGSRVQAEASEHRRRCDISGCRFHVIPGRQTTVPRQECKRMSIPLRENRGLHSLRFLQQSGRMWPM